ncbi:MAG: type IV secretion system DNA-binding domain-containing protein [Patescibacteria group bacterium]
MTLTAVLIFLLLFSFLLGVAFLLWGGKAQEGLQLEGKFLVIKVPKENEKDALAAEQMFASLHGLLKITPEVQEHFTFEMMSSSAGVYFYTWVPEEICDFVKSQIFAQYPDAEIKEAEDYTQELSDLGKSVSAGRIVFSREDFFPIKTFPDFNVDPLAGITGALSEVGPEEQIWVQIALRPVPDVWQSSGYAYIDALRSGEGWKGLGFSTILNSLVSEICQIIANIPKMLLYPEREEEIGGGEDHVQLSAQEQSEIQMVEEKLAKMGFATGIRVMTLAPTQKKADSLKRSITASFTQFSTANLNSFVGESVEDTDRFLRSFRGRSFPEEWFYILNTEELASVFHLPHVSVETPTVAWSDYKKGEPPLNLPIQGDDISYFARTTFRDRLIKFGIKDEDRPRHMYVVGKTGTGKTTLFRNMMIQEMQRGEGVGFVDPHGDSIDYLMDFVPPERVDDVVLFDPADKKYPVGFNMLELENQEHKSLVASGLIDVFRKRFEFSWGPRLEHILRNCVMTLLEVPNTTLLGVTRLLQDKNYRKYIVHKVEDPVIKRFWEEEFKGMLSNNRLVTQAIAPIQNRLGQFLSSPIIRNIVGQAHSSIDFYEVMNEGKILFVNLSKGKIGVDDSSILGSMFVSRMQYEAMRRVELPEEERKNFLLYVDEFQNFASGAFANILSEARKYHLCLNLTHQYVDQLPEEMCDAVFGNVGTIISFTLGSQDAEVLANEFAPVFTAEDIIGLERYHVYLELMIDGMSSQPFSAVSLPPVFDREGTADEVLELSRKKYGRSREKVEKAVAKWNNTRFDLGMSKAEEARNSEGGANTGHE